MQRRNFCLAKPLCVNKLNFLYWSLKMFWKTQWQQRGLATSVQSRGASVNSSPRYPRRLSDISNRCCAYIRSGVAFGRLHIFKSTIWLFNLQPITWHNSGTSLGFQQILRTSVMPGTLCSIARFYFTDRRVQRKGVYE